MGSRLKNYQLILLSTHRNEREREKVWFLIILLVLLLPYFCFCSRMYMKVNMKCIKMYRHKKSFSLIIFSCYFFSLFFDGLSRVLFISKIRRYKNMGGNCWNFHQNWKNFELGCEGFTVENVKFLFAWLICKCEFYLWLKNF